MWGSVFGLLSTETTCTYRPPICSATLPYSFSAATTETTPVDETPAADPDPQAAKTVGATSPTARTAARLGGTVPGTDVASPPAMLFISGLSLPLVLVSQGARSASTVLMACPSWERLQIT